MFLSMQWNSGYSLLAFSSLLALFGRMQGGVSDNLLLIFSLLRKVKMFISMEQIIVPFLAQRILVPQCFFCCLTELYSTVSSRVCLLDVMSRGHLAKF